MAIERISINIRSNIRQIKSELADVDSELKSLQKLKIDLNLQVRSDRLKEVKKEISDIDIDIKKLQANRAELRISDLQADKAKKKVQEINYEIGKLRSKKAKLQVEAQELKGADTQLNKINRRLEQLDHKKTRLQIDLDDAYETTKSLGRLKTSLAYINATKAKVNISSNIGDVGRQLDKLSNKMFGVLNPLKSQISQWIGLGAAVNIVNKAINEITGSVGSAISRVDTMNKYPKVMQALGHSAEQSQKSIADLSEGIEGLPTKLDDIVSTNQRMVSVAGNIDKATQATLGLNNAFLASGADAEKASRGMEQYLQMLSSNKVDLMGWRTLMETMPVSLTKVANAMGFVGDGAMNDLYAAMQDGNITFGQLNDKFIELGTGTGELARLASTNSEGIATSFTNLRTAVGKGVAGIITKFDEMSQRMTGNNLSQNITDMKSTIKDIFGYFEQRVDGLEPYIRKLMDFNWKEFSAGFSEGAKGVKDAVSFFSPVAGFIKGMITWLGDGSLEKGLGKLPALFLKTAVAAKVLGKALKIFGKVSDFKLPSLFGKKNEGEDGGGFQFNFDAGKMLNQVKNVALVYGVVEAVSAAAQALKDISDKVPSDTGELAPKLANMAIAIGGMGAFIVAAGKLAEKDPVAAVAGIASIAFIEGELILAAEAVRQISDKVPSDIGGFAEKMANVAIAIGGMGALVAAAGVLASMNMVAAVAGLAAVALISVDLMAAAEAIKQINGKVPGDIAKFADKMANMAIAIGGMEAIVFAVGALMATGIGALIEGAGLATVAALAAELMGVSEAIGELEEKVPDDFSEVEGKINTVAEVIEHITASNLGDAFNFFENTVSAWNISAVSAGVDNMVSLAGKLEELAAIEIPDGIQGKINGIEEVLKEFDGTGLKELFKSFVSADNIKALEAYAASIKNIGGTLESLDDISFDKDKAVGNIRDIRDTVTQISDTGGIMFSINASSLGTAYDAVQDILGIGYKLNTIAQGVTFDPETASKKIAHIQDAIKKIGDTGFVETINMETVKEKIDTFYGIAQKVKSLGGLEMDMEKIRTAISGVDEAVGNINAISSDVNLEAAEKLVESFETLIDDLNGLADKFTETGTDYGNGIYAGFDGADPRGSMAAEIDGAVTDLGEKESQFSKTGKAYGDAMNKSFGAAVAGMADKVSGQLAAITEYVASFGDLGMRLGDSLRNGFNIAIGNMKSDMALQVSQMQSMANSLSLPSTGSSRYGFASGGEVPGYYAKGGYARPKGTDTVPAMLTPGEFVQSRKAVGTFGRDFMQRVNSLDMQGALRSLAYRFNPHTMAIPSVSNVVNHVNNSSYQNNAKIVQNIQGGNPDYCMRRASRYLNKR